MSAKEVNVYAACDKAIKALDRMNVEAFGRLKLAKWDRINIIQTVVKTYRESANQARKRYFEVAFEAYLLGLSMCGIDPKKAHRMAEKTITAAWVTAVLKQTDFITLYRFDTEAERKAYRLAETLEVSDNRNQEIDRALRHWSRQIGQYAINMTDYAMVQAFEDAGVTTVQWVAQMDERVCSECSELDGQVFQIDELPRKPHINCRCNLIPVAEDER